MSEDARLVRVKAHCEGLPGAEATTRTGQHWAFEVRGKKFAYYRDDHRGDGRVAISCKAPPGEQQRLVAEDVERYFVPSYLGARGWVGVFVDTGEVDWGGVEGMLTV